MSDAHRTASADVTGLHGTRTVDHLRDAFGRTSRAVQRYTWFAQRADIEGYPDTAAVFRSLAEQASGHALGLLEFLADVGDPDSGVPIGETAENLRAALANETRTFSQDDPAAAAIARQEGFHDVAEWFESLARAGQSHVHRLRDVHGDPS